MSIRGMALLVAGLTQLGAGDAASAQTVDAASAMAAYQARTRVVRPCRPVADAGTIVVCARDRLAEQARFRLPLPDEARDLPPAPIDERKRLMESPAVPCGNGAILQKCGFVGVRVKRRL